MAATNNIIQEEEEEEVKLWVPDPENRVVVVGLEENNNKEDYWSKNILPRVCRICGKSFGSGKALGGHMRIHNHDDRVLAKEEPIVCVLCGKGFRSMKSLYGHMRCHSESDRKGIKPPDKLTGGAVDLKDCLTSWRMTARRGRKPRLDFSRPPSSIDDKHDQEAVKYLMMLSHGKYHGEFGISNPITARAEDQEIGKRRFDLNEMPTSEGEAINGWVSKP